MRALTLDRITPTMRLGKTLYSADGRVLLHKGTALSEEYLGLLKGLGFAALYVEEPGAAPAAGVSEATREEAMAAVRDAYGLIRSARGAQVVHGDWPAHRMLYQAGAAIANEIAACDDVVFQVAEIQGTDDYTYAHSTNVAILGLALARELGLEHHQLVDLAIGLLLHDVGKLVLPPELLDPDRQLTEEERGTYLGHAKAGYALLQSLGPSFTAPTKIVALQHHERWDGSGHPKGLKGPEIHLYAQICAVVDVYDRLTTSAAYGAKVLPHEALEYLMGGCGRHFSYEVVKAFLDIVAPYPLGTIVRLNTGEEGVVVRIEKGLNARPALQLRGGSGLAEDDFELYRHPDRVIVEVLAPQARGR